MNRVKETINMLMDVGSYFGEHQTRLMPIIKFLVVSALPFILFLYVPSHFYKLLIIFICIWITRAALTILCNEKAVVKQYLQTSDDEYASSEDLIRVTNNHEDGLVEYVNGEVAYIIQGYFQTYGNDDALSIDVERFLKQLSEFNYDVVCHNVVDEFKLQQRLSELSVYSDEEIAKQRVNFYIEQDDICSEKTTLYKVIFVVKSYRHYWKKLKDTVEGAVKSDYASVFRLIEVADTPNKVNDIISRDLCTNVNLDKMLLGKYKNHNYYDSRVLFFGDDVPERFQDVQKDSSGMEERRVIEKVEAESSDL